MDNHSPFFEKLLTLPQEFIGRGEVKGFKFTRQIANPRAIVYRVDSEAPSPHYEVFRPIWNTRFNKLSYPTSKSFGLWAWSYLNEENAYRKFIQLSKADEKNT